MKYLGINLAKYIQDIYVEATKLKKEIKEDQNKQINIPCPWIERITLVKISVLPNFLLREYNPDT